jgi:hypothetical protein
LGEKNPKYEYNKRAFPLKKAYKKDKKEIKEGGRERESSSSSRKTSLCGWKGLGPMKQCSS